MTPKNYTPNRHSIWVTDSDWRKIKERARAHGMSTSGFLLAAARANNNQNAADGAPDNAEMRRLYESVMEMAGRHRRLEMPLAEVTRETSLDGCGGTLDLRGTVRALYLIEADKRRRRAGR